MTFDQLHSDVDTDVICQVRSRGILIKGTTAYHTPGSKLRHFDKNEILFSNTHGH